MYFQKFSSSCYRLLVWILLKLKINSICKIFAKRQKWLARNTLFGRAVELCAVQIGQCVLYRLDSVCCTDWTVCAVQIGQCVLYRLDSVCCTDWTVCAVQIGQCVLYRLDSVCCTDWTVCAVQIGQCVLYRLDSVCCTDWTE